MVGQSGRAIKKKTVWLSFFFSVAGIQHANKSFETDALLVSPSSSFFSVPSGTKVEQNL